MFDDQKAYHKYWPKEKKIPKTKGQSKPQHSVKRLKDIYIFSPLLSI